MSCGVGGGILMTIKNKRGTIQMEKEKEPGFIGAKKEKNIKKEPM